MVLLLLVVIFILDDVFALEDNVLGFSQSDIRRDKVGGIWLEKNS
jgi:hypothetical protein